MTERTINFHCTEGNSDKVYQLRLIPDGEGYRVLTQYGPRGGRQTQGEKTNGIVPLDVAEKIFAKEHKARLSKGYQVTGESIPQLAGSPADKVDSGLRPMLLNPIEEAEAQRLILDDKWMMQIKHDGERCMVRVLDGGVVEGINRKGQVRPLPAEVVDATLSMGLTPGTVLDGELIGATFIPFDLLARSGVNLRCCPASQRSQVLTQMLLLCESPFINHTTAYSTTEKTALLHLARLYRHEGVVFKRADAPYSEGRPASGGTGLKFKFVESATVRVAAHTQGKRSVTVEVQNEAGAWINVGNCTIPANYEVPAIGTLAEVQYLYFTGGALYQPVYRGQRSDLDEGDCRIAQLKLKGEGLANVA